MKQRISQETLKIIACLTMLADHIGVVLAPHMALRLIGRLSFPIFCFLLVEGFHHTRSPGRYALRLLLGGLLAELPFDLVFYGGIHCQHQNVMLTLLIAFFTLCWMEKTDSMLPLVAGVLAAELLRGDYGGTGVVLVWLFSLFRENRRYLPVLVLGMGACFFWMDSGTIRLFGLEFPLQIFGLGSLLPILCYSGEKRTNAPVLQWSFYLFYPAHLIALYGLNRMIG